MIITLALAFGITACAGANNANLIRVNSSKEKELRQYWKEYTVFTRDRDGRSFQPGPAAVLYEIKNGKKILKDNRWKVVTTAEGIANARISESSTTAEILGQYDVLYGYLVYRSADGASVKIINDQTVQLGYTYFRNYRF